MQETPVWFLGQEDWLEKGPTPVFLGFPCGSAGKESTDNVGDLRSIPGLGRSPGEGIDYPLQYSGLENSMDCIVHEVTESGMTEWLSLSLEPGSRTHWAHVPPLRKRALPRACGSNEGKPLQWEAHTRQLESSPGSVQLEKSPRNNEDSAQPKINK